MSKPKRAWKRRWGLLIKAMKHTALVLYAGNQGHQALTWFLPLIRR